MKFDPWNKQLHHLLLDVIAKWIAALNNALKPPWVQLRQLQQCFDTSISQATALLPPNLVDLHSIPEVSAAS